MRIYSFGLFLLFGLSACTTKAPTTATESSATKNAITLSTVMARQLPLAQASIQPTEYCSLLSGHIEFDPNTVTRVYPLVNGVIRQIYVSQGDRVHRGEILADVYSSDFASAVSDFQKASAALLLAGKDLTREQELLAQRLIAPRDLEQSENDHAQAQAEYNRSLNALTALGGTEDSKTAMFHITAPIDGTVVDRQAQPGSQVRNDGSVASFTIGSTASLWVSLDAYPNDLRNLHVGDSVILKAAGFEDQPFLSRIQYISPTVDPTSFTTKVRCTLPNSNGILKPAMFVGATVYHPDGPGLFVPARALFYDADGKTYVFVQTAPRSFRKQEVSVGQVQPDRVQITSGLSAGDTVVADHALFLNDELQADQK